MSKRNLYSAPRFQNWKILSNLVESTSHTTDKIIKPYDCASLKKPKHMKLLICDEFSKLRIYNKTIGINPALPPEEGGNHNIDHNKPQTRATGRK